MRGSHFLEFTDRIPAVLVDRLRVNLQDAWRRVADHLGDEEVGAPAALRRFCVAELKNPASKVTYNTDATGGKHTIKYLGTLNPIHGVVGSSCLFCGKLEGAVTGT